MCVEPVLEAIECVELKTQRPGCLTVYGESEKIIVIGAELLEAFFALIDAEGVLAHIDVPRAFAVSKVSPRAILHLPARDGTARRLELPF